MFCCNEGQGEGRPTVWIGDMLGSGGHSDAFNLISSYKSLLFPPERTDPDT